MKKTTHDSELARELRDLWNENGKHMGEQAAYNVSCETLEIDPDEGYELLALLDDCEEESEYDHSELGRKAKLIY